jgi:hypothetical protein
MHNLLLKKARKTDYKKRVVSICAYFFVSPALTAGQTTQPYG